MLKQHTQVLTHMMVIHIQGNYLASSALNIPCRKLVTSLHLPRCKKSCYLSSTKNRVFGRVIWMILRWNFKHCRNWIIVIVNYMPNQLCNLRSFKQILKNVNKRRLSKYIHYILINENNVYIITLKESFEAILNLSNAGICG